MSSKIKRVLSAKTIDGLPIFSHVTSKRGRPSEDVATSKGHYVPMKEYRRRKAVEAKKLAKVARVERAATKLADKIAAKAAAKLAAKSNPVAPAPVAETPAPVAEPVVNQEKAETTETAAAETVTPAEPTAATE